MNYQNIYESLITKRQKNPAKGYTERHHILPKSLGGSDDPTNLVVLSGREHWVAHLLLYKIHKNSQTIHACNMMAMRCEERGISYIKNSHMYQKIRIECAKNTSKVNSKHQAGKGNSQYGTIWISNIELRENKKISKTDLVPAGWVKGRNKWRSMKVYRLQCCHCNADYETIYKTSKYCSRKCSSLAGRKHSDEAKQKMRKAKLGKERPDWVKVKVSKGMKLSWRSRKEQ